MAVDYTDFEKLDFSTIDPEKLDLGTCLSNCALITQTFERGAHSTYTEAAVFAPFARTLENTKTFAATAQATLKTYIRDPADIEVGGGGEAQSFNLAGNFDQPLANPDQFAKKALEWAKDCIPCISRIMALVELNPSADLLGAFEADIKARLGVLTDIMGLLNNMDMYNELCALLSLLNFMCIPDLQRIIALLAALLAFEAISLDGLIGMLQAIIAPLFMPIFSTITGLLDQFTLLVVSPIDCIVDAINEQLRKINAQLDPNNPLSQASNGLKELNKSIVEGKQFIQAKLDMYIQQMKAMLDEFSLGDIAYTKSALRKLTLVRMIGFVTAIITAIAKGQSVCSTSGSTPTSSELDNFFTNFLNPNSSFKFWVDDNGEIHIDQDTLPNQLDVIDFNGEKLLDPQIAQQINDIQTSLTQPTQVQLPCRFSTSKEDVDKVNQWIEELNAL